MGGKGDFLKEEVFRLYAEGQSVKEIAELVDVTYEEALRWLKKKGVHKTIPPSRYLDTKKKLFELMDEGKTVKDVALEMKLSIPVVNSAMKETTKGKKKYEYGGKTFESYEEMENFKANLGKELRLMHADGLDKKNLAEKFGISVKSVARFLD